MTYTIRQRDYRLRVDTLDVSGLHCAFDVTRTKTKEPNTAEITIYNLSAEHRKQIENLSLKEKVGGKKVKTGGKILVELEAGYVGSRSLLFRGHLRYAVSAKNGGTWETKIEGDDGGKNVSEAEVSRSFPAGTQVSTVVRACAQALGVGTGNLADLEATLRTEGGTTFTGGTVLFGKAASELDRVLRSCGYRYSIQNQVLQITRPGRSLTVTAVRLTGDVVPSPVINPDGTINVDAPILPDLYPGSRVQLDTEARKGLHGIKEVNYVGDTSPGGDWLAKLTCIAP